MKKLKYVYAGMLWAMERHMKETNQTISRKIRALRREMSREFGLRVRLSANFLGPVMKRAAASEVKRLASGKTYEPRLFVERKNWVEVP